MRAVHKNRGRRLPRSDWQRFARSKPAATRVPLQGVRFTRLDEDNTTNEAGMLNAKAQGLHGAKGLCDFATSRLCVEAFLLCLQSPDAASGWFIVGSCLALPRSNPRSVQAKIKVNQA